MIKWVLSIGLVLWCALWPKGVWAQSCDSLLSTLGVLFQTPHFLHYDIELNKTDQAKSIHDLEFVYRYMEDNEQAYQILAEDRYCTYIAKMIAELLHNKGYDVFFVRVRPYETVEGHNIFFRNPQYRVEPMNPDIPYAFHTVPAVRLEGGDMYVLDFVMTDPGWIRYEVWKERFYVIHQNGTFGDPWFFESRSFLQLSLFESSEELTHLIGLYEYLREVFENQTSAVLRFWNPKEQRFNPKLDILKTFNWILLHEELLIKGYIKQHWKYYQKHSETFLRVLHAGSPYPDQPLGLDEVDITSRTYTDTQ